MPSLKILVVGATGKQGRAVIQAITENPPYPQYEILALTRNATSASAQALAAKPNVQLVIGDLNRCDEIFQKAGGPGAVHGVFNVQVVSPESEEVQGKALIDVAIANNVKHFIYSSVDRGGTNSDNDPTDVPHFISKHNIERHLQEKAAGTGMSWTILRPVAFMDNLTPDFIGRCFAAMWSQMGNVQLQLVSTKDIGRVACVVFAEPDQYRNKAVSLAGDQLTQAQANDVFWKVYGRAMPRSYDFVGSMLQYMISDLRLMFRWFTDVGYKADTAECRRVNPKMQDLETWLKEDSKFKS